MAKKSIKAQAIADAQAILSDPDKLAKVERWFFNKEVCGTVADLYYNYFTDTLDPFKRPETVADAIERFQFPLNPRPELSGAACYEPGPACPPSVYYDACRYWGHFMEELSVSLQKMRVELLPGETVIDPRIILNR